VCTVALRAFVLQACPSVSLLWFMLPCELRCHFQALRINCAAGIFAVRHSCVFGTSQVRTNLAVVHVWWALRDMCAACNMQTAYRVVVESGEALTALQCGTACIGVEWW
jgi:hypothetical protein